MRDFFDKYMQFDFGKIVEQLLPVLLVFLVCTLAIKVLMRSCKKSDKENKTWKRLIFIYWKYNKSYFVFYNDTNNSRHA